jgi:hypothetical protein
MPDRLKNDHKALLGLGLFQISNIAESLTTPGNINLHDMGVNFLYLPLSNSGE